MNLEINLFVMRLEIEFLFFWQTADKRSKRFRTFRILLTIWKASLFARLLVFETHEQPEYLWCGYNLNYGKVFKKFCWK
jgi:hypothetical protein